MPVESTLRQWALQTSLKGVPRAMRTDSCPSRWLWWFGTMGFLCLAFWQCGKLIEQYLQHNYAVTEVILTEKHDVDLHDVIEPVFTFCNLNPFDGNANIAIDKLGLYQLAYYTNFITNLTHCDGCPDDELELLSAVQDELLTSRGYFAFIGPEAASQLSHRREEFIAACYTRESRTEIPHEKPCTDDMFTEFIHPDYYSCWVMHLPQWKNKTYTSVSLVFHLNNFFDDPYHMFSVDQERGQFLGALMAANNLGTFPFHNAIYLQPGGYLDIKLDVRARERLGEPYNICTDEEFIANTSWYYTKEGCVSHCIESIVVSHCGCRSLDQLNILANEPSPMFCLDSNKGRTKLLENVFCAFEKIKNHSEECEDTCQRPCSEIDYVPSISSAYWPPDPFGVDFYNKFIANKTYAWKYDYLPNLTSSPDATLADIVNSRETVSRNFLRVDIHHGSVDVVSLDDVASISLPTLISNLGGSLNLFAGITVVIIVEILDLLLIILYCNQHRANKEPKKVENIRL